MLTLPLSAPCGPAFGQSVSLLSRGLGSHSISPALSSKPEAARPPLLIVEADEQPNSKQVRGGEQKL